MGPLPQHSPLTGVSLSVETGQANDDEQENFSGGSSRNKQPLDERILDLIATIPDRTIRPGRLAAEFGFSVEDASAELCGLLAAVGEGATFRFERTTTTTSNSSNNNNHHLTMVFTFHPILHDAHVGNGVNKRSVKSLGKHVWVSCTC